MPGGTNGRTDFILKNPATGSLRLVPGRPDGDATALWADGRPVLFTRLDSHFDRRVFVRDRTTGEDWLMGASAANRASPAAAGLRPAAAGLRPAAAAAPAPAGHPAQGAARWGS